jgi:hypothetical protein
MAKGMSIEELRKSLESDATKQLDELKTENENLTAANKYLKAHGGEQLEKILEQQKIILQLENRCIALSGGVMCDWCGLKVSCPHSPGNKFLKARGYIK